VQGCSGSSSSSSRSQHWHQQSLVDRHGKVAAGTGTVMEAAAAAAEVNTGMQSSLLISTAK
jgi:hypothetical protein